MPEQRFASSLKLTSDADSPASTAASHHDFVQIAPSNPNHAVAAASPAIPGASLPSGQPLPQIPGGATVYTPTSAPGAELNPRSCVTCRRRKVRCDKLMPCSNCRRALIPCIFPAPERAPRRPRRKDPNNPLKPGSSSHQSSEREIELLKRLRKLEGIVEELSGQVELEAASKHATGTSNSPENTGGNGGGGSGSSNGETPMRASSVDHNFGGLMHPSTWAGSGSPMLSPGRLVSGSGAGLLVRQAKDGARDKDSNKQYGRLVINDYGRSRYVSSAFWSKINDELDELRSEAQRISGSDNTDESDDESTPLHEDDDRPTADHHAFIFGFQSTAVDLRPLHPLPSQIPYIWQVYQENVDPLVKILHTPTISKLIREARTNLDNISPAAEALMFAIYYAAVNSLEDDEIKVNFMAEKSDLINKYRFALEQALAKANFLTSSELVTLQAFVLLLVLVRRHEDTRFAWTLTGLAIRIAHSIGLHRDGTNFPNLTPFEIEMRRRLFWALLVVDMRCAEDQGTDLSIIEQGCDTLPPLNINDSDISPESTSLPPSRDGVSDMTFVLIRFEICSVARRLHAIQSAMGPMEPGDANLTLEERERMIHEVYDRVEKKYLTLGDPATDPAFWVAGSIARVICAKMTLVIYQPVLFSGPGMEDNMPQDTRDRLFTASTELFEYTHALMLDARTKQWRWLFQTYTNWLAVAFVLMEAARRPWTASVERAWHALNSMMASPGPRDLEKMADNTSLFVPLKMLYNKARKHRNAEIERLRDDTDAVARLDKEDRSRLKPTMFSAYHGSSHDGLQWRERWLHLVGAPHLIHEESEAPPGGGGATAQTSSAASSLTSLHPATPMDISLQQAHQQQQQQQFLQLGHQQQPQRQQQQPEDPQTTDCPVNLLNSVFSAPTFASTDLFPLYSSIAARNLAKEDGINGTEDNGSGSGSGTGSGNVSGGQPSSSSSAAAAGAAAPQLFGAFGNTDMPRQDTSLAAFSTGPSLAFATPTTAKNTTQSEATPLVDAMVKDYPPPWLWAEDTANPSATGAFPGVLGGVGGAGDDADIKMDDDFDWQDFGQTLGGMSNGVWSSHGL